MIPAPNVIAGILTGIANDTFLAVIIVPFIWGLIFCGYVGILKSDYIAVRIESYRQPHCRRFFGSAAFTVFFVEYTTAVITALIFAAITFGVKVALN